MLCLGCFFISLMPSRVGLVISRHHCGASDVSQQTDTYFPLLSHSSLLCISGTAHHHLHDSKCQACMLLCMLHSNFVQHHAAFRYSCLTSRHIFAHLSCLASPVKDNSDGLLSLQAELHCVYGNSSPMSASYEMLSSQAELHCVRCSRNPFSISDGLLLRLQAELHGVHSNSNLSHCNDPSLAELSSRLTKEQLPVVCNCLQRMLHPDLTKRAEVGEALELMAQLSATLPQLIPLPNQADPT